MITYLLFIAGFAILIKGADWLVDGASSLAKKLKIPVIVIGLTIVAFGTSAPNLAVSISASAQGRAEIAIGNVLGGNIFNIFLILGIASVIFPLAVKKNTVWKEIPLSLLAAIAVGIVANDVLIDHASSSAITRIDGLIFLAFFAIFMWHIYGVSKAGGEEEVAIREFSIFKSLLFIGIGLICLVLGGKWIVDGAVQIAAAFDVSESLIGLTIVAAGTSLPELAISAVAAYKKNADIAVGNIVGSNIFNIFLVLGISSIIRPLPFSINNNVDVFVTIGASLALFAFMFIGKRRLLERWQGVLFIAAYIVYVIFLIIRG
jgi:cation:H+ antiporter